MAQPYAGRKRVERAERDSRRSAPSAPGAARSPRRNHDETPSAGVARPEKGLRHSVSFGASRVKETLSRHRSFDDGRDGCFLGGRQVSPADSNSAPTTWCAREEMIAAMAAAPKSLEPFPSSSRDLEAGDSMYPLGPAGSDSRATAPLLGKRRRRSPRSDMCTSCHTRFPFFSLRRRFICRKCHNSVCGDCSNHRMVIPEVDSFRKQRVCNICKRGSDVSTTSSAFARGDETGKSTVGDLPRDLSPTGEVDEDAWSSSSVSRRLRRPPSLRPLRLPGKGVLPGAAASASSRNPTTPETACSSWDFATLRVVIVEAKGLVSPQDETLASLNPISTIDSYCIVQVDDGPEQKTSTIRNSRIPRWNDQRSFPLARYNSVLRITVMDSRFAGRDGVLATVEVPLQDLHNSDASVGGWVALTTPPLLHGGLRRKLRLGKDGDADCDLSTGSSAVPQAAVVPSAPDPRETGMLGTPMRKVSGRLFGDVPTPRPAQGAEIHIQLKLANFRSDLHFLAHVLPSKPPEPPPPPESFNINDIYGPSCALIDIVWDRFLGPIIYVIIDLIYWEEPFYSLAAIVFWIFLSNVVYHWLSLLCLGTALHIVNAQCAGEEPNPETGCVPTKQIPSPQGSGRFEVKSLFKSGGALRAKMVRSSSFSVGDEFGISRAQSADGLPSHDSAGKARFNLRQVSSLPLTLGKSGVRAGARVWSQRPRFLNASVQLDDNSDDDTDLGDSDATVDSAPGGAPLGAADSGNPINFRWMRKPRSKATKEADAELRVGRAVKVLSRTMPRWRKEWCIWLAPHLKWWAGIAQCANDIANGRHRHSRVYMWSCVVTAVLLELWEVYLTLAEFAIAIGVFFLLLHSPLAASIRGIRAYARWMRLRKGPPAAWQMKPACMA